MRPQARGVSTFMLIVIVAAVMAFLVTAFILYRHASSSQVSSGRQPLALTPEQSAYLSQLEFTDLRMSAAENFLGDTVTFLDGRVTNKGPKVVRRLDIEMRFVDTLNQVVLREKAHPVTDRTTPLKPGETRPFRVSFEHLPADWNLAPPTITAAFVAF